MDKQYFLNAGIQPMSNWQALASPPETQPGNFFLNPNWEKSTDQYTNFESALSSMVSSPAAPNSAVSSDSFAIRELIGKLSTICNSGEISPSFMAASSPYMGGGNNSANTSCYNTPLNSPPKLHVPIMDNFLDQNLPNLRNSIPLSPNFPAISADPGFVERAAKFSCFGSQSFNGRTTQFGPKNTEFQPISNNPLNGSGKLPRISSSPSIKLAGSSLGLQENKISVPNQMELNSDKKLRRLSASAANSNEDSSVSEQIPCKEKTQTDITSRKRKAISKGKLKETATKENEANDDSNPKRSKQKETKGNVKTEDGKKAEETEGPKPPEPPKDYIHVRARRGQATDSHSLAERVRREKISERMKLLQDLVPGCNKVTGKALMLDEIINYVQSLQRQVEFLSMKLATVNPRMDFNMETLVTKDIFQQNGNLHHPNFDIESSFYGHQHTNITSGSMGPLDTTINCHNFGLQSSQPNGFVEALPQFATFFEDDLQSIVQMGFNDNLNYHATNQNQKSQMKLEL